MKPSQLSQYLRKADDAELHRRRWTVGLSLFGVAMGQIVTAYQTGLIPHLPDPPPHDLFDADQVDASDYAYENYVTPDGVMMIANYAVTAWLASAGGPDRAERKPWLSIATAGKAVFDAGLCLSLAKKEWQENRALCAYCQAATVASLVTVATTLPEAIQAVRVEAHG